MSAQLHSASPANDGDDTWWEGKDPEAKNATSQSATSSVVAGGYVSAAQHVGVFADRILAELELRVKFGDNAAGGEELGFTEVDEHMVVEGGRLIVMGAREGVGKTAFGLQTARTIATRASSLTGHGGQVVYYITEMGIQETVERVVATFAHLDSRKLKRGVTTATVEAVRRGFDLLEKSGLFIVNAAGWTNEDIVRDARAFHRDNPDLRAVFVDNLTGINPARTKRAQGSHEYIGEIVESLNMLSMTDKGIGLPVILLAHLVRPEKMARTKRPTAFDFAGSDKINRWASILVLLHEKSAEERSGDGASMPFGGFGKTPAFSPEDTFEVGPGREKWKRSEVGTPDAGCSHEFIVVKNRGGRKFVSDLDFIGAQLRFVDPKGKTVRPYEMPPAEPAARSQFREQMRALGDLF